MPWDKQFDVDATLDRAVNQFWEHGYESTTMQELVDCTGVNRASLYATYGDKRAIFIAALQRYDVARRQAMLGKLANVRPLDAIRRLFAAFSEQASDDTHPRGCFLANTAIELAAHDEEVREIVARAQRELEEFFRRKIEEGQAAGDIPDTVDAGAKAQSLLAALLGLLVLVRSRPEPRLLRGISAQALAALR